MSDRDRQEFLSRKRWNLRLKNLNGQYLFVEVILITCCADEDFNSTPWGMTYTALTQRPIQLTPIQEEELRESVMYDFRQIKDEEEEIAEDNDLTPVETSTPVDDAQNPETRALSGTIPIWKTKEYLQQQLFVQEEKPLNITPATTENNLLVLQHHTSNPPLKSLYAEGLKLCQPDNAINAYGEPPFTNWAQGYKETLDYMFVLEKEDSEKVKLLGLLKMPKREEMGEGEPQEGRFPSDHVCEIAEIDIS
jgi:RNA exonuclease NGL2